MKNKKISKADEFLLNNNKDYDIIEIKLIGIEEDIIDSPFGIASTPSIVGIQIGCLEKFHIYICSYGYYMFFNPEDITKSLLTIREKTDKLNRLCHANAVEKVVDAVRVIEGRLFLLMNYRNKNTIGNNYRDWKKYTKYQNDDISGDIVWLNSIDEKRYEFNFTKHMVEFIDRNSLTKKGKK